jgi:predicted RNA-binding Zn-ribbon protein involved in translation (DUF1610 family)
MASREHYDVNIECSKCGEKSVLDISENDYPFMRNLDRKATCTTDNFKVSMKDEKTVRAICNKCGQENFW